MRCAPGLRGDAGRRSPQVAEYYSRLSDDTIHWFLKVHHENLWPRIEQIIEDRRRRPEPFVLEGAALRPEYIAPIEVGDVSPVLLYGENDLLRQRMIEGSRCENAARTSADIISKFIERSIRENDELLKAANEIGIRCVDVAVPGALDALMQEFLHCYGRHRPMTAMGQHGPRPQVSDAPIGDVARVAPRSHGTKDRVL
jgi:2-phosphoglycerate kinase